jgi:hypothetical protein
MVRTELPSRPWEHLAADFMGPLLSGHHLFAVVDYYSRWVEIAIMTTTPNAEKAVEALEKMLMTHGLPSARVFPVLKLVDTRNTVYTIVLRHDPYSATILYYEVSVSLQLFRDDPCVLIQELVREALVE